MSVQLRVRVRRRRSRRRRRMRRLRLAALIVLVTGLLSTTWLAIYRIPKSFQTANLVQPGAGTGESISVLASKVQLKHRVRVPSRPVYQYSVIPGGVQSGEELRQAVARDPEVAAHYAGFHFDRARVLRLERAQLMYLSYRKNGKIYWTRGPHLIPAGETVITDGEMTGRTRCANRLSVRKQLAVSPDEPPQYALETVEPPPMLPPENINFPALYHSAVLSEPSSGTSSWIGPKAADPWMIFPPPLPVSFGGRGCRPAVKKTGDGAFGTGNGAATDDNCRPVNPPPQPPPSTVPEPGTWVLLATGMASLLLFRVRKPGGVPR